jgi:hypothetical protein
VTEKEWLESEIDMLGQILAANALALRSKTMSDDDWELLRRQMTARLGRRRALQHRLAHLSS